ncbi:alcohol acetyltransferase-domain-containing protein [Nemania sp. FL0031]|nr:alcohol acetyltransferase-domain-containing protein [Nemania sp. FL0031]
MTTKKKDQGRKATIIRPLGNLECYQFHMLQLRFLGSTIVNCRYIIPPSLAAPKLHEGVVANVEDALAQIVLEHPGLRVDSINADTRRPAWVAVEQVDLEYHVRWEDVDSSEDTTATAGYEEMLRKRIERILDEPYAKLAGRPQWRVLVLFKKGAAPFLDIVFDYSHALGDGMSGKIFHETLLRVLNTPTSTEASQPALVGRVLKIPSTARTLPPPIEKAGKFPVSPKFAVSTAWKELRPPSISSTSPAKAHWAPIRATPYKTQLRIFDVEPEVLRGILAACRAHQTTITGLLHALVLVSMASHIPARDATAFTGSTALDLRRYLGPRIPGIDPTRTITNYVSATHHEFGVDLVREIRSVIASGRGEGEGEGEDALSPAAVELVWKCAALVRSEIQSRLDLGLKNNLVGLMKLVLDWRAQFRADAAKPRTNSFIVTNLGVLDGVGAQSGGEAKVEDRWGVAHSVFAISTEVCGAAFQVSPISVRDGALCVSCSWQDCVVGVKLAESIVADLGQWLRLIGKS